MEYMGGELAQKVCVNSLKKAKKTMIHRGHKNRELRSNI
jgi:hypothetical protein